MNATRRPIPEEILAAVAAGAMPLAVFADFLEDQLNYPAKVADDLRKLGRHAGRIEALSYSGTWDAKGRLLAGGRRYYARINHAWVRTTWRAWKVLRRRHERP